MLGPGSIVVVVLLLLLLFRLALFFAPEPELLPNAIYAKFAIAAVEKTRRKRVRRELVGIGGGSVGSRECAANGAPTECAADGVCAICRVFANGAPDG